MTPELRARITKLADELADSPHEQASAYADAVRELADPERDRQVRGTLETHLCAWEYVPYHDAPGVETPEWRCVKRWSDGSRCRATRGRLPTDQQVTEYHRP